MNKDASASTPRSCSTASTSAGAVIVRAASWLLPIVLPGGSFELPAVLVPTSGWLWVGRPAGEGLYWLAGRAAGQA